MLLDKGIKQKILLIFHGMEFIMYKASFVKIDFSKHFLQPARLMIVSRSLVTGVAAVHLLS